MLHPGPLLLAWTLPLRHLTLWQAWIAATAVTVAGGGSYDCKVGLKGAGGAPGMAGRMARIQVLLDKGL